MRDYYRILGVSEGATPDEIKRAYRRMARACHPDFHGDAGAPAFVELQEAFETLSDAARRRSYDSRRGTSRPRAPRADWLADEVGIDFPSVSSVIERVSEAFLAAESGSLRLSAEIILTRDEAASGITLPLEVPVRLTCPGCGGRGETWMERCRLCEGTGLAYWQHPLRVSVPSGVSEGDRFSFSLTPPSTDPTVVEVRIRIQ